MERTRLFLVRLPDKDETARALVRLVDEAPVQAWLMPQNRPIPPDGIELLRELSLDEPGDLALWGLPKRVSLPAFSAGLRTRAAP